MTQSEFETLRNDVRSFRAEIESRLAELRADIEDRLADLRTDFDKRFMRLEAKIDEKPGVATIYQAAMGMFAGMFAVMFGTIIALKTLGFIH